MLYGASSTSEHKNQHQQFILSKCWAGNSAVRGNTAASKNLKLPGFQIPRRKWPSF